MATTNPEPSKKLVMLLVLAVLATTAGLYLWVGNPQAIKAAPAAPSPAVADAHGNPQIEAMVARLAERLKAEPGDVEGWSMLGRSQLVLGRGDAAVQSLRKRLALEPKDATAMADLADAIAFAQGRRFDGEPEQLLRQALQADPRNTKVLELAGTMAFDRRDYKTAVVHWNSAVQLVASTDPNGPVAMNLRAGIEEAQRRGGLTPPPLAQAATAGAQVSGRIELAAALKSRVQPEDTVLIFARVVDGPRMPVAILKRQAKELPIEFVLDEKAAMNPSLKLSPSMRVTVGVRITRSGQAMAQPGDLQGFSQPVPVGSKDLRIEINQVVP